MRLRGLRHIRQRLGVSISQLAVLADIRRDFVTRLEQGQDDAEPAIVRRLSLVLGVSQRELVTGLVVTVPLLHSESV